MTAARVVAGFALISAWAIWWGPSIILHLVRLLAARVRFGLVLLTVDGLFLLRRNRAARNLLAATIRRARRDEREAERRIRERRR